MEMKIDSDLQRVGDMLSMEGDGLPLDVTVTGIFVRAKDKEGAYHSVDIALLDANSLRLWLRSRGGKNAWAENVVGRILGHEQLVKS